MASFNDLKIYADIDEEAKTNLLLGNGLSIGVRTAFSYPSLKSVALAENFLKLDDSQLFDQLSTSDFEMLMRRLKQASEINKLLDLPYESLDIKYDSIKNALISTVRFVHPRYDDVSYQWMRAIVPELRSFERIFTTNYDLLLYWIQGSEDFEGFTDFFWSDGLRFDPFNTDKRSDRREVYYLHGALFMFSLGPTIFKLERSRVNPLLDHIGGRIFLSKELPVFVSEGRFTEKINSITQNSYLNFAFRAFNDMHSGLTVYGHSLNEDADWHILRSINENAGLKTLAVSIYAPGERSEEDVVSDIQEYERKLRPFLSRGGTLEFYRFDTSPFYYEPDGSTSVVSAPPTRPVVVRPARPQLLIDEFPADEDLPF